MFSLYFSKPNPSPHSKPGQHLGEIANDMGPLPVDLGEDVEDKRLHVEVKSLVVQKKLGQKTQILAVNLQEKNKCQQGHGAQW